MTGDPRPRVLADKCDTCVFHPDNRMHLAPGRLADLTRANLAAGTLLTCHKTLPYGDHPEVGEAACRGFFDAYGDRVNIVRIMRRFAALNGHHPDDWYQEVPAP